jgi:hypothetical protein
MCVKNFLQRLRHVCILLNLYKVIRFVLFRLLLREQVVYPFPEAEYLLFKAPCHASFFVPGLDRVAGQVRLFRSIRMLFNLNKVIKTGVMV